MLQIRILLVACGFAGMLASCAVTPTGEQLTTPRAQATESKPNPAPSLTNTPSQSASLNSSVLDTAPIADTYEKPSAALIIKGKGKTFQAASTPERHNPNSSGDVSLTFVDADVKLVIREVLGETLGYNYTFDPGIQGKVTLQSSKPLPRDALFSMLEATLRLNNIALVRADGVFHVVPLEEAVRRGLALPAPKNVRHSEQGFGVEIVQLRFVPVGEMRKLLEPFAPHDSILLSDPERNLLLLAGTRDELDTMKSTIDVFDVDLLHNQSLGIFTPQFTNVDALARELRAIFQESGSGLLNFVKLVPITRLNKLIAISQQPQYLDNIQEWIERLDENRHSDQAQVFIYTVQHGKADDLANSLNKLFGDGATVTDSAETVGSDSNTIPNAELGVSESSPKPATTNLNQSPGSDKLRIVSDEKTNTLLIHAEVKILREIKAALVSLDTAPLQVLIEASIAEVTLTDDLRFGVQWFIESKKSEFTLTPNSNGVVAPRFPGFSVLYQATDIRSSLNALESVTNVNVLSSPKLMVLNNQTAMLQVGDQVPIITQSAVGISDTSAPIVNSVELHDTGVILNVTPRINHQGLVQLDVQQEVSDVIPTTSSSINSPTIQQRKINTIVSVQDGETVALGGLIRDRKSQNDSGIPYLSSLPLIGHLFGDTGKNTTRTELIVFITPRVVRDLDQARQATAELRAQLRGLHTDPPKQTESPTTAQ